MQLRRVQPCWLGYKSYNVFGQNRTQDLFARQITV